MRYVMLQMCQIRFQPGLLSGTRWGSSRRSAPARPKTNLAHFIFHRTHPVEGKFNMFIDKFSVTNKPTIILRIS